MLANNRKAAVLAVGAITLAWATATAAEPPPIEPWQYGANKMSLVRPALDPGEVAWADLLRDEPYASRTVLDLASAPKTTIPLLQKKLKPLKVDKADVKKWIVDLENEKDDVWKPAFEKLSHFDPRLALDPAETLNEAKTAFGKRRLAAILAESPDPNRFSKTGAIQLIEMRKAIKDNRPGNFVYTLTVTDGGLGESLRTTQTFSIAERLGSVRWPTWVRDTRAIAVLEHIRGPEALAILKDMATGHPDALPTWAAKQAVARLTAPTP